MTVEERKRALKRLTRNQVFCDLKHLIGSKPLRENTNISLSFYKQCLAVNEYRAKKHIKSFLRYRYNQYLMMYGVGRFRKPNVFENTFIHRNREELPGLNLFCGQNAP